MARFLVHADAKADLIAIGRSNAELGRRLIALVEELQSSPDWIEALTIHDFGSHQLQPIHVSRWLEYWNQGKDLWRLKFWELENDRIAFRFVYALKRGHGDYYLLAVVHREFNYETGHAITSRILQVYESL